MTGATARRMVGVETGARFTGDSTVTSDGLGPEKEDGLDLNGLGGEIQVHGGLILDLNDGFETLHNKRPRRDFFEILAWPFIVKSKKCPRSSRPDM